MTEPRINGERLWASLMELAQIGARIWAVLRAEMTDEPEREPIMFSPELAARASTKERR